MRELLLGRYKGIKVGVVFQDGEPDELIPEPQTDICPGDIYRGRIVNVVSAMGVAYVTCTKNRNVCVELMKGQKLIPGNQCCYQIKKEAFDMKNPYGSQTISLKGRYAVLFMNRNDIGISKKIKSDSEVHRLKRIASENRPDNMGIVIRTEAENISDNEIINEITVISEKLCNIAKSCGTYGPDEKIYSHLGLCDKLVIDIANRSVDCVKVESIDLYNEMTDSYKRHMNPYMSRMKLYHGTYSLFDLYSFETKVRRLLSRKLWLDNGGFLIVEKTEAMTIIDVNSGKFSARGNANDMALAVNIKAAEEIIKILKIRNTGGIIVIDFINMKDSANREALVEYLKRILIQDRGRTTFVDITGLDLVELVRKRIYAENAGFFEEIKD